MIHYIYGDPSYAKHFYLSIQGQVSASILFLIFSSADFCNGKKLIFKKFRNSRVHWPFLFLRDRRVRKLQNKHTKKNET
jgi:hypothetical protein